MSALDPLDAFPLEIAHQIIDELDIWTAIKTSHVSRSWREIVRSARVYWQRIELCDDSPSPDLFLSRLQASRSGGVCLRIQFEYTLPGGPLTLTAHLHRLRKLNIQTSMTDGPQLLDGLKFPAPGLEVLELRLWARDSREHAKEAVLPTTIFAGCSPVIREITLHNIHLPDTVIECLAGATNVSLGFNGRTNVFARLCGQFPRATRISIDATGAVEGLSSFAKDIKSLRTSPTLAQLDFNLDERDYHDVLAAIPRLERVPVISCIHPSIDDVSRLLGHLDSGPLRLVIGGDHEIISTSYSDQRGFRRLFPFELDGWSPLDFNSGLFNATWLVRVETLCLSLQLLSAMDGLPPLLECKTLHLTLEDGTYGLNALRHTQNISLRLPALTAVTVRAQCGISESGRYDVHDLVLKRRDLNRLSDLIKVVASQSDASCKVITLKLVRFRGNLHAVRNRVEGLNVEFSEFESLA